MWHARLPLSSALGGGSRGRIFLDDCPLAHQNGLRPIALATSATPRQAHVKSHTFQILSCCLLHRTDNNSTLWQRRRTTRTTMTVKVVHGRFLDLIGMRHSLTSCRTRGRGRRPYATLYQWTLLIRHQTSLAACERKGLTVQEVCDYIEKLEAKPKEKHEVRDTQAGREKHRSSSPSRSRSSSSSSSSSASVKSHHSGHHHDVNKPMVRKADIQRQKG